MDATEMKQAFLIEYDNIAAVAAPPEEAAEISYYLSKSEHEVLTRASDSYEDNETMRKKLANMLVPHFKIAQSSYTNANDINSFYYDVPDNVIKVVRERFVALSGSNCYNEKQIKVTPKTQDEIDAGHLNNPFNTPDHNKVWRLDHYDDSTKKRLHQIITGNGFTPKEYGFLYIREAEGINVDPSNLKDSILHADLHDEIISAAVRMATAAVRQQNYQVAMNEQMAATDK